MNKKVEIKVEDGILIIDVNDVLAADLLLLELEESLEEC